MQAALDAAERHLKDGGDLVVGQVFELTQHEQRPIVGSQQFQLALKAFLSLLTLQRRGRLAAGIGVGGRLSQS